MMRLLHVTLLLLLTAGVSAFSPCSSPLLPFRLTKRSSRLRAAPPEDSSVSSITPEQASVDNKNDSCDDCGERYIEVGDQAYFDGIRPGSSWELAKQNFVRQGSTIIDQLLETIGLKERDPLLPPTCLNLKLSNEAVAETERKRLAAGEGVPAHPVSQKLYDVGCQLLDVLFDERPIPRFWFLETIARIPYFAYVSMLHLYESFGWWRAVELRKVHAAEGMLG